MSSNLNRNLKRIGTFALPALGIAMAAASFGARANDPQAYSGISAPELQAQMISNTTEDRLAGLVGKPVYDENGVIIGTVSEVVVADMANGDPAILLVSRLDGEMIAVPLGESDEVVALLNPAQGVAALEPASEEAIVTRLIVPEYRTPESPGS